MLLPVIQNRPLDDDDEQSGGVQPETTGNTITDPSCGGLCDQSVNTPNTCLGNVLAAVANAHGYNNVLNGEANNEILHSFYDGMNSLQFSVVAFLPLLAIVGAGTTMTKKWLRLFNKENEEARIWNINTLRENRIRRLKRWGDRYIKNLKKNKSIKTIKSNRNSDEYRKLVKRTNECKKILNCSNIAECYNEFMYNKEKRKIFLQDPINPEDKPCSELHYFEALNLKSSDLKGGGDSEYEKLQNLSRIYKSLDRKHKQIGGLRWSDCDSRVNYILSFYKNGEFFINSGSDIRAMYKLINYDEKYPFSLKYREFIRSNFTVKKQNSIILPNWNKLTNKIRTSYKKYRQL